MASFANRWIIITLIKIVLIWWIYVGTRWAKYGTLFNDEVEFKINLNKGKNVISLLSVTTGLQV